MKNLTARSLTEEIDRELLSTLKKSMPGKYYTYLICAAITRWLSIAWVLFFVFYIFINVYLQNKGIDIPQNTMINIANILIAGFAIFIVARIIAGGLYGELTSFLKDIWNNIKAS